MDSMEPSRQSDQGFLAGRSIDELLDVRRGMKFELMKRFPDPFPQPELRLGRSPRWSRREVFAWIERQRERHSASAGNFSEEDRIQPPVVPAPPQRATTRFDVYEAKRYYELGRSLDDLCRELRVGKARLIKELRAAGAELRKPGRPRLVEVRATTPNAFTGAMSA